jgi:hypothetical protein
MEKRRIYIYKTVEEKKMFDQRLIARITLQEALHRSCINQQRWCCNHPSQEGKGAFSKYEFSAS